MNTYSTLARTAAVIAGVAFAMPVFGQAIDVGITGNASSSASMGQSNASANANANAGVSAGANDSTDSDGESATSTRGNTDNAGIGSTISVNRGQIASDSSAHAAIDPLTVNTHDNLNAYAHVTMSHDEHIQNINASEEEVSLEYSEHAHLFGIFPVVVSATASVDAEGEVKVRYPWYRFLMSTEREALESSVEAEVRATLDDSATATMSAQMQARVLNALHRAMKSHFDATVAASADASVN